MSCNTSSPELTTIDIPDHQFGRVSGRLCRLKGSSGVLRAIPDEGYQFVSWQTDASETHSTSNPLHITSWDHMSLTPVFEPITLTLQDFQDQDAVDALVWYLEKRGVYQKLEIPNAYGTYYGTPQKFYSAGDYTTASGSHDRFANSTPKTLYPMRYGFNYGDETTGTGLERLGKATYDPVTNTTTGVFLRSPATYEHRDSVTVPQLIHRFGEQIPVSIYGPGGLDGNYFHYGYDKNNSGTYHANGLQFPMLQYARSVYLSFDLRYHKDDWIDLTGLEDLNPQHVRVVYFDRDENGFRDIDAISSWDKLSTLTSNTSNSKWSRSSAAWRTTPTRSPRPIEAFTYCYNLQYINLGSQTWDPDSYENIDENPGWVTQYNNTPRSGDVLRVLRYTPAQTLHNHINQNVTDYTLTNTYFSNLNYIYNGNTLNQKPGYDLTETYNNSFKNCTIQHFVNTTNNHNTSNYNFLSGGNLIYFYDNDSNSKIDNVEFVEGSTICRFHLHAYSIDSMIVDPLYGESVALHADFTSSTGLDRSRYQSTITHSDTGVTTTSIN